MSRPYIPISLKNSLIKVARGYCEYCKTPQDYSTAIFEVEHITPFFLGGKTVIENLALACRSCNSSKYTHTHGTDPISGKDVRLFHPRKQRWEVHFKWSEDFTLLLGITPTGQATIKTLKMNKLEQVNLRRLLFEFNEHPPKI